MSVELLAKGTTCLHLEKRIVERISKGVHLDRKPDLVLWICHFPLFSSSGIQCPVFAQGSGCPHCGPYGRN